MCHLLSVNRTHIKFNTHHPVAKENACCAAAVAKMAVVVGVVIRPSPTPNWDSREFRRHLPEDCPCFVSPRRHFQDFRVVHVNVREFEGLQGLSRFEMRQHDPLIGKCFGQSSHDFPVFARRLASSHHEVEMNCLPRPRPWAVLGPSIGRELTSRFVCGWCAGRVHRCCRFAALH